MNRSEAIKALNAWSQNGRAVFTVADMRMLFPHEKEASLSESLRRMVKDGILARAAKGIYVYMLCALDRGEILEAVASAFRRTDITYISLESALSQYGVISQVPIDHLTLMTTGKKGTLRTPWGVAEFTHTARPLTDILNGSVPTVGRFRLASPATALRDLRRVGRNMHLVDMQEFEEADRTFKENSQ